MTAEIPARRDVASSRGVVVELDASRVAMLEDVADELDADGRHKEAETIRTALSVTTDKPPDVTIQYLDYVEQGIRRAGRRRDLAYMPIPVLRSLFMRAGLQPRRGPLPRRANASRPASSASRRQRRTSSRGSPGRSTDDPPEHDLADRRLW